jgi:hypothetical protein
MVDGSNGGPQLTWSVVIAGILAFCALSAGFFTIVQNQFNAQDRRIDTHERALELIRAQYLSLREHSAFQHEQEVASASVLARLGVLETAQRELIAHAAHVPVEGKEVDILSQSIDKRFEAAQQQINDINRQIAASILVQPQGYAHPQPPANTGR